MALLGKTWVTNCSLFRYDKSLSAGDMRLVIGKLRESASVVVVGDMMT